MRKPLKIYTTLGVSPELGEVIRERKGALSVENFFRKLMKMPLLHIRKGRPPIVEEEPHGKKRQTAKAH